jgi:hypothetical protein
MSLVIGCIGCKSPLGLHVELGGESGPPPESGDVIICAICATIQVLDESLRPRRPTEAEAKEILEGLLG